MMPHRFRTCGQASYFHGGVGSYLHTRILEEEKRILYTPLPASESVYLIMLTAHRGPEVVGKTDPSLFYF